MSVIGSVSVRVVPSFAGFNTGIDQAFKGIARQAGKSGSQTGASFWKAVSGSVRTGNRLITRAVTGAFSLAGRAISRVATTIGSTFMRHVATPIVRGGAAVGRAVAKAFTSAPGLIRNAATATANWFMGAIAKPIARGASALGKAVGTVFRKAGWVVEPIASVVGKAFMDRVVDPIQRAGRRVGSAIQSVFSRAQGVVSRAASAVGSFFMDRLVTPIANGARAVGAALQTAFSATTRWVTGAAATVGDLFIRGIVSPIQRGASAVGNAVQTAFTASRQWVTDAAAAAGRFFVNGIVAPIGRGASAIGRTIGGLFSSASGSVSDAARSLGARFMSVIPEPIKESGRRLGIVVSEAFTASSNAVSRAASTVGGWFSQSLVPALSRGGSRVGTAVGQMFSSARSVMPRVGGRVGGWFNNALVPALGRGASRVSSAVGGMFSGVVAVAGRAGTQVSNAFSSALSGMGKRLTNLGPQIADIGRQFGKVGETISGVGATLTKSITVPAAGAATAIGGIFVAGGFKRLVGIDTAQAKLKALGHDAGSVESIMENALAAVKGTAFGLDEAATTASSAVAAGIKPGKELEGYLTSVGDAAAIAGTSMGEMGSMFNKVSTSGRAYTGDLMMLGDRGIPIVQYLGEELGKTSDQIYKMASDGAISSEMYLKAVQKNIGGAAGIMGAESFTAAFANVWAAVNRVGASFLDAGGKGGGFFSQMKPLMGEFTATIDTIAPKAETLGVKLGSMFASVIRGIRNAVSWWQGLESWQQKLMLSFAGLAVAAGPVLLIVGKFAGAIGSILKVVGPVVGRIGAFGTSMSAAITKAGGLGAVIRTALGGALRFLTGPIGIAIGLFTALWANSEDFRNSVINLGKALWDSLVSAFEMIWPQLKQLGSSLAGLFATIFSGGGKSTGVMQGLGKFAGFLVDVLGFLAQVLVKVAAGLITGLLWGINKVLPAITWLVQGIFSLAGTLIGWFGDLGRWLLEGFTGGWDGWVGTAMGAIGSFFVGLVDWVKNFLGINSPSRLFADFGRWLIEGLGNGITSMLGWLITVASAIWSGLTTGLSWAWTNVIQPTISAIGAIIAWLWNNVAMPYFGLIKSSWTVLANAFMWAWTNILQPTFSFLGTAIAWLWNNIAIPAFAGIRIAWNAIATAISWAWTNIIQPTFRFLGSVISWLWTNIAMPIFGFIRAAWSALATAIQWAWTNIAMPVFRAVGAIISWLWTNIAMPYFGYVKDAWGRLANTFMWAWKNILQPVFRFVGAVIGWLWNNVALPYFSSIRSSWSRLANAFMWAWRNILSPMFSTAGRVISWLWSNVARPMFGFIKAAWDTMSQAIRWAWNNILRPAWNKFAEIVRWLWNNVAKPVFAYIRDRWDWMTKAIRYIWATYLRPMFQRVGQFIKDTYHNHIKPAFGWIRDRWNWLKDRLSEIWNDKIKPIFRAVYEFVEENVVDRIKSGIDMIKDAWNGLANIFRKPINWVIKTVWNDGIAKAFNKVASAVGSTAEIKPIDTIPKFATGGAVRGKGTGTSDDIVSRLSNGEHVLTAKEVRLLGGQDAVYDLRKRINAGESLSGEEKSRLAAANGRDFTSAESDRLTGRTQAKSLLPVGDSDFAGRTGRGSAKKQSGWDKIQEALGNAASWVAGGLASIAEKALNPFKSMAKSALSKYGQMGTFGMDLVGWGIKEILGFSQAKDDEHNAAQGGGGQGLSGMDAFLWALRQVESNQRYTATNPYSDASGAYQFISSTWGGYGGYRRAADAPADVQDARARRDASRFYSQYGNWEQAAAAWLYPALAGNRGAWGRSPGVGNPTVQSYVNKVMAAMRTAEAPKGGGAVPFTANPGGFNRPSTGAITSRFGPRNFSGYYGNMHYGIDLAAGHGAPVRAAWSGSVNKAGRGAGTQGTIIDLNHGDKWTRYFHLSGVNVSRGQQVRGGQIIGREGGTGGVAPHLHFELHRSRPGSHPGSTASDPGFLFRDKGGLIPQGISTVLNKTGGNEYVSNQRQFDNMVAMGEEFRRSGSTEGMTVNQHVHNYGNPYQDAHDLKMQIRRASRKPQGVR